ncbi:MAG: hypothetical protein OEW34_04535 [Burkholderiaceae bacterium]|jgi:hypothetical protein|nr:hypothetical protein [Burkholderiaceae bacterium]
MNVVDRGLTNYAGRCLAGVLAAGLAGGAAAADFRGFVTDGPAGLLVFQSCQGASLGPRASKLSDKSPDTALTAGVAAVRQVMENAGRPLYVEFAGDDAGSVVTVRRFRRAVGHILSCAGAPRDIPAGARLHASGVDPNWRFVATPEGGRLELADGKVVRFPASPFSARDGAGRTQRFDAWSAQDGGTVRIEVTEEMCIDERAETATGARVALRYSSTSVEGCAARF